jgi:hypothetical protein
MTPTATTMQHELAEALWAEGKTRPMEISKSESG